MAWNVVYVFEHTEPGAALAGASNAGNAPAFEEGTSGHESFPAEAGHWYTCEPFALRAPCGASAYLSLIATLCWYAASCHSERHWIATQMLNPVVNWLEDHPDTPVQNLEAAVRELDPPKNWGQILELISAMDFSRPCPLEP